MIKAFCLALLFSCSVLYGAIFEVQDLAKLEEEVLSLNRDALVLFDVDYTLLTPKDAALKPCGKALRKRYLHGLELKRREWLQSVLALESEEELMDPKFPLLIQEIQKKFIPVFAFTALEVGEYGKIASLDGWRIKQLNKFGMDFYTSNHGDFTLANLPPYNGSYPLFREGVLFTNRRPKGEVLLSFLSQMKLKPSKILFMDDSIEQIRSVEAAASQLGIEFIGFHYTLAASKDWGYDPHLGEFQFRFLIENEHWLSDPEAMNQVVK